MHTASDRNRFGTGEEVVMATMVDASLRKVAQVTIMQGLDSAMLS